MSAICRYAQSGAAHGNSEMRVAAVSDDAGESFSPLWREEELYCAECEGSYASLAVPTTARRTLLYACPRVRADHVRANVTLMRRDHGGGGWVESALLFPSFSAYSALATLGQSSSSRVDVGVLYERGEPQDHYANISFARVQLALREPGRSTKPWSPADRLAAPRFDHAVTALASAGLALGGTGSDFSVLGSTEVFELGAWTPGPPLAVPRRKHAAIVLDGVVFAIGGCADTNCDDALACAEALTAGSSSWSLLSPLLHTPRYSHGAAVCNGSVFAVGGQDANGNYLASVEVAPITAAGQLGNWSLASSGLSTGRAYAGVAVYRGHVYACGGRDGSGAALASCEIFDGSAWSTAGALLAARHSFGMAVVGTQLYAVGGVGAAGAALATVDALGGDGSWRCEASVLGAARSAHNALAAVGGTLLVAGGEGGSFAPLASAEQWAPPPRRAVGAGERRRLRRRADGHKPAPP